MHRTVTGPTSQCQEVSGHAIGGTQEKCWLSHARCAQYPHPSQLPLPSPLWYRSPLQGCNGLVCVCVCVCVRAHALSCFHCVRLHTTLCIVARQAALSMGFFRQEYWSGFPCPPPGDLSNSGIEPESLTSTYFGGRVLYHKYYLGSSDVTWYLRLKMLTPKGDGSSRGWNG